ncbi:MAG: DUF2911 domain-containing protein [Fimbriimonadaceae bacterium]|nr:DUF2911 domain-containing protein [Chitinophagales bacterium]
MENKSNRVSPQANATATIDENIVAINYGSPKVKGRVIWGGLVPYNEVWRTGANEATTIEFTKDVFVEGQPLKKDIYALFTIPTENEWTVIFSTNSKQWGAFKYNEAEDALRIKVKPTQSDSLYEDMVLYVKSHATKNTAGKIQFAWEKLMLDINFENASGK